MMKGDVSSNKTDPCVTLSGVLCGILVDDMQAAFLNLGPTGAQLGPIWNAAWVAGTKRDL